MEKFELIAPCHFGMEAVLKREILDLGKLLGAVLNKVDMKKEKYYSKYNSYYYGKSKQE